MKRYILIVCAVLLLALRAHVAYAATHTVYSNRATGGTYYAFPNNQSLTDWATYRVQLVEGVGDNAGRYSGTLDDANGLVWVTFSGASQPSDWSAALGYFDLNAQGLDGAAMRGTNGAYTGTPPTAAAIVDEFETQSQLDPTGFHVNVLEIGGTAQTANDNGADINNILLDTAEIGVGGAGLTDLGGMSTGMKAQVQQEVNDELLLQGLDHLLAAAVAGADVTDDSLFAVLFSDSVIADFDDFDNTAESLPAIRARGDSAWTTGSVSSSDYMLLQTTTIATLNSQTVGTLTAGSADDRTYEGELAIIIDQSTTTQKDKIPIAKYDGDTLEFTLARAPRFTIATGDTINIVVNPAANIDTDDVVDELTWFPPGAGANPYSANEIRYVFAGSGSVGITLQFDLTGVLGNATINSIDSVTASGGNTLTFANSRKDPSEKKAMFDIDVAPVSGDSHTVTLQVTTSNSQPITVTGSLRVP